MSRTSDGRLILSGVDELRLRQLIEWAAKKVVSRRAFAVQEISDFVRDWDERS